MFFLLLIQPLIVLRSIHVQEEIIVSVSLRPFHFILVPEEDGSAWGAFGTQETLAPYIREKRRVTGEAIFTWDERVFPWARNLLEASAQFHDLCRRHSRFVGQKHREG